MPFFPREAKDIVSESLQRMSRQTNITQLTPGGKARFFLSTVSEEQERQQTLFDSNLLQPYIKYSDGKLLDFFGDMLKLPRIEATHAEVTSNNFMFYVQSGVFGDINGVSAFTLPASTAITTVPFQGNVFTPGLESQPAIGYKTLQSVVCQPNSSFIYIPIRADIEGEASSLPRNTLSLHTFTGYSLSSRSLLKCTNRFAIDSGVDRERDDSYRFRLSNLFAARNQAIYASVRLAALSVPGVADVTLINAEQGPGTFGLYIRSITPSVSPSLVNAVSTAVGEVVGYGIRPFVSAAKTLGLELVTAVNWSSRSTTEEISAGYAAMRNIVEDTINGLGNGEPLDLDELVVAMLGAAPGALSIGRNTPNKFEEAYLYRTSQSSSDTTRNRVLSGVLSPLYNERLLLETSTRYKGIQFITF